MSRCRKAPVLSLFGWGKLLRQTSRDHSIHIGWEPDIRTTLFRFCCDHHDPLVQGYSDESTQQGVLGAGETQIDDVGLS